MPQTWQGWMELDEPPQIRAGSQWLDLSHPYVNDMPRINFFPAPRFEQIMARPANPLNVTEIQLACHVGTHVDAPIHFIADGPSMEQIPLERLYGPGVVWRLEVEPYALIQPQDFQRMEPGLRPGDILILDTGYWENFFDQPYDRHASLSEAAAQWLVDQKVKLLGVDLPTVDLPTSQREKGFNWPVHYILLSHGVLVSEHLTNLRPLAGRRIEAMFLPLNVPGADGAPARVVARPA